MSGGVFCNFTPLQFIRLKWASKLGIRILQKNGRWFCCPMLWPAEPPNVKHQLVSGPLLVLASLLTHLTAPGFVDHIRREIVTNRLRTGVTFRVEVRSQGHISVRNVSLWTKNNCSTQHFLRRALTMSLIDLPFKWSLPELTTNVYLYLMMFFKKHCVIVRDDYLSLLKLTMLFMRLNYQISLVVKFRFPVTLIVSFWLITCLVIRVNRSCNC